MGRALFGISGLKQRKQHQQENKSSSPANVSGSSSNRYILPVFRNTIKVGRKLSRPQFIFKVIIFLLKLGFGLVLLSSISFLTYLGLLWLYNGRTVRDPCMIAKTSQSTIQSSLTEIQRELFNRPSEFVPIELTKSTPDFEATIPKIIHQQWKDERVPKKFMKWKQKWVQYYPEPEYTHMLWTDTNARELIVMHYPWFLKVYDGYEHNINRADAARYFILHHHGGIYADLDYEPTTNFYNYIPQNQVGMVESPYYWNEKTQNCLMSSPKNDPFWIDLFTVLTKNSRKEEVLEATGPILLDQAMEYSSHPSYILPCENFQRVPLGEYDQTLWTTIYDREIMFRLKPISKHLREGFRRMGVKMYFDANQKVTGIYDSHKEVMFSPGDKGWEGAKFLARSSAFTLLTAREHLYQTHLLAANYLSFSSIKHLPPSHPLRRLINVFTFRTNRVNADAFDTLVPELSILHRTVAFEYDSLRAVFENAFQTSNVWEPFPARNMRPELLEMSVNGKLPYHSEAVEYYNIVEKFVREWLNQAGYGAVDQYAQIFYNEIRNSSIGQKYEVPEFSGLESMVNLMTQAIFMVTCYHEIIGTVIDYTNDPECVAMRVRKDDVDGTPSTEADAQAFMNFLLLTASTGLTVPMLMKPYKNYFGEDGAPVWERNVWDNFIEALEKQSDKVEESDKTKEVEFKLFNPRKFESSVSV